MATPPLERFEREYQQYHRLSEDRCRTQQNCLLELQVHAEKSLADIDADDIRAFLGALTDRGLHVNTIAKRLNMIRPFYGWAYDAKLIDADSYMSIKRIEAPRGNGKGLPRPYSKAELERFRKQLDKAYPEIEERYWDRWRRGSSPYRRIQTHAMRIEIEAIVALALHCGLRRQEIYNATVDDIHYDNEFVVVRYAKDWESGGKFREVPHTAHSREAIRRWLELRTELGPDHEAVWLSLSWDAVKLHPMLWDRFRRLMSTIGTGWELHRFRHTYGTEMLRSTGRLEIVQRLLGHSRINQTLGYAELVSDDLSRAVEKAEADFMEAVA
jgi:site-specific recombinase XerD